MAMLEIRNVQKTFRTYAKPGLFHRPGARKVTSELPVLRGVDLTVEKGDVVAILGPSGSGKTTLLRCLNFLETADAGQLVFDGESFDLAHASRADIARLRKKTAFVFQEPRLMPWLNVWNNIIFGLKKNQVDQEKIQDIVSTVNLSGFEKAYPSQLSGGMQQRAAIARALAYEPTFILMDEPFAALDYFTREQMQRELLRVQQKEHSSIMFVTHSIDEALILGDQIVMIEKGLVKHVYPVKAPSKERNLLDEEFIALKRDIIENLNFIN